MIQALKNFNLYESFAYHISLLRQFVSIHGRNNPDGMDESEKGISSVHGNNVWSSFKKKRGLGASGHGGGSSGDPDSSIQSAKSVGNIRRINSTAAL